MAEAVVQLPPDGSGKNIRAVQLVVGPNTVYMEGCVPYDEAGTGLYAATGAGLVALQSVFGAGADITALNPLFTDVVDRAARLLGIVYGENDQLQQSDPSDAHVNPTNPLEVGSFLHVWDPVASDWNRLREGANVGEVLVDVADRAARLVGVVYGNQDQLQQNAGTLELITEDTGLHTNPRRYEKDYGFVSAPISVAVALTAVQVWAVGVACVRNPSDILANGRTAGNISTVYTMELRNPDAAVQTAWLETTGAVVVSIVYEIAANDSIVVPFEGGKTFGNMDLYINGSVAAIECQLEGTEV